MDEKDPDLYQEVLEAYDRLAKRVSELEKANEAPKPSPIGDAIKRSTKN